MAVVQNCYVWLGESQTSGLLWPSAREEMRAVANFALLAGVDVGALASQWVYASNSSDYGHCALRTQDSFKGLQAARAARERWRVREVVVPGEVMTLRGSEVIPSCFDDGDAFHGVADSRLSAATTAGVGRSTRLG